MFKRPNRFIGLALLCALLLATIAGVSAQDEPKILVTGLNMVGGDAETIDPSIATTVQDISIIDETFIGLTYLEETRAELQNGIITGYEVSEDGLTYTFNLIPELPWVRYNADSGAVEQVVDEEGNPRYVTAADVVYGWTRTLDPATAGDYAYVLAPYVVGGVEFNSGEGSAEDLGITAIDDYTLEIQATEPVAFAPNIYGLWMARPQPQWAIEEFGDSWIEPGNYHSYGPFALKEWAHDESITLIKNPFWPGTENIPQPKLDEVVFRFLDDTAQFAEYQAGTMDAVNTPQTELDRIKADPVFSTEYFTGTEFCTYYYGFNVEKPPFDNVHIRRAFSYAIDRQSIVDNVLKAGQIPAQWFSRPGLVAAPTPESHPDLGIAFNADMAVEELNAGLEDLGLASASELPAITLAFGNTEAHTQIAQAIQQMWATTLGVEVQLSAMDTTTYFTVIGEDAPQVYRAGWCADYPDANNFLYDVFRSDSANNDTNWGNPDFDALIDEARLLTDTAARLELYAQAEDIMIAQDAAVAPIYFYVTRQLTKPYVERTYSIIGQERYEKWDILPQ
jgi:oligopeptide transport system substrate-binding protein